MVMLNQDDEFHAGTKRTLEFDAVDEAGATLDPTGLTFKWTISKINPKTDEFSRTALLEKTSATASEILVVEETGPPTKTYVNVLMVKADTLSFSDGEYQHQLEAYDGTSEPIMVAEGKITLLRNQDNA